jgi:YggT family protein
MSALQEISLLLVNIAFGMVVYAGAVRFWMQWVRAPFKNDLGRYVCLLSDWGIKPLRRVIPGWGGFDWASLVLVVLLSCLWLAVQLLIMRGAWPAAPVFALGLLLELARLCLRVTELVLFAFVLLSWVAREHPINTPLFTLTQPLLAPLRKLIPPVGGMLDLSPMLAVVVCEIGLILLRHLG